MNFCEAILILKMEENKQHFRYITLYYSREVNTQLKCILLDDAPRSGKPVEVDSNQIETLINNTQWYTMQEIANILKISNSIKLSVKIKNMSFIEKTKRTFWPTQ